MNINLNKAIEIAKHQKEVGCCSANAQALVLLLDEIERLEFILNLLNSNLKPLYADN